MSLNINLTILPAEIYQQHVNLYANIYGLPFSSDLTGLLCELSESLE